MVCSFQPNPPHPEETDDLAFDASASDIKAFLEALSNVGGVNVTRKELGDDHFSWLVTFTEPATSAYRDKRGTEGGSMLFFPLLYAGGVDEGGALGLGTLGAGGGINASRAKQGTLEPLFGEVRCFGDSEMTNMVGNQSDTKISVELLI